MVRPLSFANFAMVIAFVSVLGAQSGNTSFANLTITRLYIPAQIEAYSPLPIAFNITNVGKYASGNVTVGINIYGGTEENLTYGLSGLSPGQSISLLIYVVNATRFAGKYVAYVSAGYAVNGTSHVADRKFMTFSITPSGGAALPDYNNVSNVGSLTITSIPMLYFMPQNTSALSQIGFYYAGSPSATIGFVVPSTFAGMISFSTQDIYLSSRQGLSSGLILNSGAGVPGSTYVIPIGITETLFGGSKNNLLRYIILSVLNESKTSGEGSGSIILYNNSASLTGTLEENSPADRGLYNANMQLIIPDSVAESRSAISPYGSQSQVDHINGSYIIEWTLGNILKGQDQYVYFDISRLANVDAILNSQFIFSSTTQLTRQNLFITQPIAVPVFYSNNTGTIWVNMTYTGTAPTQAVFHMSATKDAVVHNATRVVKLYPNKQFSEYFNITTGNFTGTAPLKLTITAGGINSSFSYPVLVLHSPATILDYAGGIIVVIIAALLISEYRHKRIQTPREYNKERALRLRQLREQIKRDL